MESNEKPNYTYLTVCIVYKLVTWVRSVQIKLDSMHIEYTFVTWVKSVNFIFNIVDTVYQQNTLKTNLYNSDCVHKLEL